MLTGDGQLRAAQDALRKLDAERKSIEVEAAAIVDELMAPGEGGAEPIGIETPLVDREGYPRADIDVYRARMQRKRLNGIRNDHKALMKRMEAGMAKCAAFSKHDAKEDEEERQRRLAPKPKPKFDPKTGKWVVPNWDGTVSGIERGKDRRFDRIGHADDVLPPEETEARPLAVPFARIDGVTADSPAALAGLRENDLVLRFGAVTHENHRELRAVLETVSSAATSQKEIPVTLLRRVRERGEDSVATMVISLRPRPWSGRGSLGCHIQPYSDHNMR